MIDTSKLDEPRWYVLHTFTGYENMAVDNLNKCIVKNNLQEYIMEVKVPMETVIEEDKNGNIINLPEEIGTLTENHEKEYIAPPGWDDDEDDFGAAKPEAPQTEEEKEYFIINIIWVKWVNYTNKKPKTSKVLKYKGDYDIIVK